MRKVKKAKEQGNRDSLRKETREKEIDIQKLTELEERLKKIKKKNVNGQD